MVGGHIRSKLVLSPQSGTEKEPTDTPLVTARPVTAATAIDVLLLFEREQPDGELPSRPGGTVTDERTHSRPLRTVLFVPGSEREQVEKSRFHSADAVVIDLEEPRTPCSEADRERARQIVSEFFSSLSDDPGAPLWFARVQAVDTGQTLKDLRAVMHEKLAGILLPKVQGPRDIHGADALLNCMEVESGRPLGSTIIYPILETAQALRLAYEIAMASDRVLYMGGAVSRFGDIHQALGFRWSAEGKETLFLRSKVLLDAKAAGIRYPISGMWGGDSDDLDGLRRWATELRDLGYYGMMIGNPDHIPLVHEVFSPTDDELAFWQELDRLAIEAEGREAGRIEYGDPNQGEGYVVHIAHVGSARKNLAWARDLGRTD
jgi:citrate lyase subunit beta/citryl-CoA lyase